MKRFVPVFDEDKATVDLTPMLDVVFIMLVFFVVTASFLRESGIPVAVPAHAESVPQRVESISIRVDVDGLFRVNGRVVSRGGLLPYVFALRAENPQAGFGVIVATGSRVADLAAAADAGRAAGFDVIPVARE